MKSPLHSHMSPSQSIIDKNLEMIKQSKGNLLFDKMIIYTSPECNLKCPTCFTKIDPNESYNRLSLDEIRPIIDFGVSKNISDLYICGKGEPLMDPIIWDIISYARRNDIGVMVYTNGTLVGSQEAKRLSENDVTVFCKRNTLDDSLQDEMVGIKGASKLIEQGISNLLDVGYQDPKLAIESVVTRQNIDELPDVLRYARNIGAFPYFESFLLPDKSRKSEFEHLVISSEELTELYAKLQQIDKEEFDTETVVYPRSRIYSSSNHLDFESPVCTMDGNLECARSFTVLTVTNEGDVRLCTNHKKTIGNIRESSLEIIFDATNPKLRQLYACPCDYSSANVLNEG